MCFQELSPVCIMNTILKEKGVNCMVEKTCLNHWDVSIEIDRGMQVMWLCKAACKG